ncbi:hypothetical protein Dimus_034151 [Dionaea muscipula]
MKKASSSSSSSSSSSTPRPELWSFRSPTLYLFAGITLMIGLIVLALIFLACSYRKPHGNLPPDEGFSSAANHNHDIKTAKPPEVVVIMPGDDMPIFLAKPINLR